MNIFGQKDAEIDAGSCRRSRGFMDAQEEDVKSVCEARMKKRRGWGGAAGGR